jgi:hypothetical protein
MGTLHSSRRKFGFRARHYRIFGLTVLAGVFFGAQRLENGLSHGGFRCVLTGPEFPLSDALRNEHFHAGNCSDALAGGEFEELRPLWAID